MKDFRGRKNKIKRNVWKGIVSVILTVVLILQLVPVPFLGDYLQDTFNLVKKVQASIGGPTVNLDSIQAIVDYSKNYDASHANDTIIITYADGDTGGYYNGFETMATTPEEAFRGAIKIAPSVTLNLPVSMFGYVTDDVDILDESGAPTTLKLSRTTNVYDEPLFAKNVIHGRSSGSASWSFQFEKFYDIEGNRSYIYNYSGFIGTLGENANVTIRSIINNNISGSNIANITASSLNAALVCGSMDENSFLQIDSVTFGSETVTIGPGSETEERFLGTKDYYVESSAGHAGGLVGSMGDGSKLVLGASLVNPQKAAQKITSSAGYAGGIVGYCEGGTIEINSSSPYSVLQVINGKSGAGAIAGYYSTVSSNATDSARYTISTNDIVLTGTDTVGGQSVTYKCEVNGKGNCGGLFGDVLNDGDMIITGTPGLSVNHGADSADSYGGLIGTYKAAELSDSLTISVTGTVSPSKTGGTVKQYGGLIGVVDGNDASNSKAAYVKVSGVSVSALNASATSVFGGVIGEASTGFIEMDRTNAVIYNGISTNKTFGGIVGNLGNGVLYLRDSVNFTGSCAVSTAAANSGQIVGNRDSGLVFAETGWTMTRTANSQTLDDVGSWGEVVRFTYKSNNKHGYSSTDGTILTVDTTNHYVTLSPAVETMANTTDFVKTALNIQLNEGQATGVLRCSGTAGSDLLDSSDLCLEKSSTEIELNGTGITGLTRDNGTKLVTFEGTFDGKGGSILLATGEEYFPSATAGNGKIYRHQYNGLFGKTDGATIKNIKIAENSSVNVNAKSTMYVGNIIGQATGNLNLEDADIISGATIDAEGTSVSAGGLIGNVKGAGTVSVKDCEYNGTINNSAASTYVGGFIGAVVDSNTFEITLEDSVVGGTITDTAGANVGGTIAVIDSSSSPSSGRTLTIDNLDIDGLEMDVAGSNNGGFLGYEWNKTDVNFTSSAGLEVKNGASLTAAGNTAGLCYLATGYWNVKEEGISLKSMSVTANTADSFGLIINKGITDTAAIYLELEPGAFSVTKQGVSLSLGGVTVFDELVAYSSAGDVSNNGQGVVSIGTTNHALLTMSDPNTGNTYQHQTKFLDTNSSLINNPHTRYYYNLDEYRSGSISNAEKLLMWSVYQYAKSTIKPYFSIGNVSSLTGVDAAEAAGDTPAVSEDQFDMRGYSYYPVDLTGSLTITNGNIKLWNSEFDSTESGTDDNRLSYESAQHYLIHNSLFRNVSGTFNANDIELDGNVNKIGDYCGAIVMGTVSSNATGSPATININGLKLAGIKIGSNAGPLIINKAGNNATLNISNVSNDSTSYADMGAGATSPTYIATSLLGTIGSSTANAVKLTFSGIKLDGRNATGVTNLPDLDGVYHSKGSLFSEATLVDTFAYAKNSGSFGVYNYEYSEDWGTGTAADNRNVTYGAEVDNTEEYREGSNPGVSKQRNYNNSENYTRPDSKANIGSPYEQFARDFIRYVNTHYVANNDTHELRVNVKASTTKGCGTYNDPYMIRTAEDVNAFAGIINGTLTSGIISVPNGIVAGDENQTWCSERTDHTTYREYDNGFWYTDGNKDPNTKISNDDLRKYLVGAYYKIDPEITTDITLPNGFSGISAAVSEEFVFRGVIDGSGKKIINPTTQPLIVSSNGCVVRNLELEVSASTTNIKNLSQSQSKPFMANGRFNIERCEFYGAVIGQIFGGDNIIDDVSVSFPNNAIINANSASYAYTVPIGGYVGVVVNGGLIFRNMTGKPGDNQSGLKAVNLSGFDDYIYTDENGDEQRITDPTDSNNTKWLYVNPIIGRVLNGYAITESTTYKPFEDGSRLYPDGTTEYWHVTESGGNYSTYVDTNSANKVGVTMRNGTKNYSIADIATSDTNSFAMSGYNNGADITLSSAQALYIMSLITQCGMGKATNGKYAHATNKDLKPYDEYMATHLADYTNILTATSTDDPDYAIAKDDVQYTATLANKIPYIIKTYTPKNNGVYPAFAVAGRANVYYDLILSGNNTTFYLPDSYRGLGTLMFGVNKAKSVKLDNYKDNIIFLNSLNGNNKTVSMNMNLRYYNSDNYSSMSGYQGLFKTGFAFIDALQSSEGDFYDLTLRGDVTFERMLTTGVHADYSAAVVGPSDGLNSNPAVAAFVGVPVAGSGNIVFRNIELDSMALSGMCYSGGFVGALNIPSTLTFTGCKADDLKVFAGGAAGGLIGYMRNKSAKVVADFGVTGEGGTIQKGTFGIISIISALNANTFDENNNGAGAAGGLIGYRKTGESMDIPSDQNIIISNVTIKNGSSKTDGGYIGYDKDGAVKNADYIAAGGVVGRADKPAIFNATNVSVENLNIAGGYSGGMIGILTGENSKATFTNCNVISSTSEPCTITNSHTSAGAAGGFIGQNNGPLASTITDSILQNYTIQGIKNIGGFVGYNKSTGDLTITNDELSGYKLKGNNYVGGLIGYQETKDLVGYNILIKDQNVELMSGASIDEDDKNSYFGYIVGYNNSRIIKLVGFSRQGSVNIAKMVGNSSSATSESYGTDGYVIFADYKGAAGTDPHTDANTKYSNMLATGRNVGNQDNLAGSKKTIINYQIVAQNNSKVSEQSTESVSSSDTILYKPDGVTPLGKGETLEDYSAATKIWKYVDSNDMYVKTLDDLDSTRISNGFKIYVGGTEKKWVKNNYQANKYSIEMVNGINSFPQAGVWHIIKSGSQYILYVTDQNGDSQYIKEDTTGTDDLYITTNPAEAQLFTAIDGGRSGDLGREVRFTKTVKSTTYYLGFRGGKSGLAFNKASDAHTYFQLRYISEPDAITKCTTYAAGEVSYDGTTITCSGEGTTTDASTEQKAQYDNLLTDSTYEVYLFTKTVEENDYRSVETDPPYVTVNPRYDVAKEGNTSTQWLTGDGVSGTSYYDSAAIQIYTNMRSTEKKRYQHTGIEVEDLNTLATTLRSNMMTIDKAVTCSDSYTYGQDFPVLLIDDISTADFTVNNYLKLLTNTNYKFSDGYSDGTTFSGSDKLKYNVSITKWKYDEFEKKFVLQDGEASLKCSQDKGFFITSSDVDNLNWQISLIDVQFYDPNNLPTFNGNTRTDAGLIAYHLYVPVVVKKMLHYDFRVRPESGTKYELSAYPSSEAHIVDNLGNPITMRVSYTYQQDAQEWENAINSGESVYRYYKKILELTAFAEFPNDSMIVLVDPNNDVDKYYYSNFNSSLFTKDTERSTSDVSYYTLDLSSFTNTDTGESFQYPLLNDLMNVSIDSEATTKNLVLWDREHDSPDEIVAVINAGSEGEIGTPLKYSGNGTGDYAVKVALKEHHNYVGNVQENYYLSIFTKENTNDTNDTNIYHYTFASSGSTLGPSYYSTRNPANYPTARDLKQTSHIFLGKIYTNTVTLIPRTNLVVMSSTNNTLEADMIAHVGFTQNAIDNHIQNYLTNSNVHIHQTFLFSLNELKGTGIPNERGILVDPLSVNASDYYVDSVDKDAYRLNPIVHASYIELPTSYDIKNELKNKAEHPRYDVETEKNDYTIEIKEHIAVSYSDTALSMQFPKSDGTASDVGTYMIGYSNISSASNNAVSSHASVNTDADTANRWLYYIENDSSVVFSYNASYNQEFEDDGNGNYGQLGLDGNELDLLNKHWVQINTAAYYNIYEYAQKQSANYVKLTVELSKKDSYNTPLDIPTYLKDFEILDKNNNVIRNGEDDALVKKDNPNHIYTYIIPKTLLKTESEDAYSIPIRFKAYSGNNSDFETKTGGGDMEYSNYKVNVTVGLLQNKSTEEAPMNNSDKFDHVIYTNAKIHSEIIDVIPPNSGP